MSAWSLPADRRPPRVTYLDLSAGLALAYLIELEDGVLFEARISVGTGLGRLDASERMVQLDPTEALLLAGAVIPVALRAPNGRAHLMEQITRADVARGGARPFDWAAE